MKKTLLLPAFTILFIVSYGQNFHWAKSIGTTPGNDVGKSIAIDAAGNVYTTGYFTGITDFDPGAGSTNLTSAGGTDIFILKLDAGGNLLWAKGIGSPGDDQGISLTLDASANVYVTGSFTGTADFDQGAAITNLTSAGSTDIFVLKLDAAGNFAWAKSMGGTTGDAGYSVTVDLTGNVYTTGFFSGTADLDPGSGTASFSSIKGSNDIFISKLDAAGNFLWAKGFGDVSGDYGRSITVDPSGNVYLTGSFSGLIVFNISPGNFVLTSNGSSDIFILKFTGNGAFGWGKNLGGSAADTGYSIKLDASGNVYTTGSFSGTADFDPDIAISNNITSAGGTDIFISKLDATGNFVSAKTIGGAGNDCAYSLCTDGFNNVYTAGSFNGTVDFDNGPLTHNITSAGSNDIFILKCDATGNFTTAKTMGGAGDDIAWAMAADNGGFIYTTGIYNGTADFDPGTGNYNLTSSGGSDLFISKLGPTSGLPVTLLNFEVFKNLNDARLTWQTSSELNSDKFEIEKSTDGLHFEKTGEVKAAGNSNTIQTYHFIDKNAGTNFGQKLFYRFLQFDLDGKFVYSPVRSINFKQDGKGIGVFPNPSHKIITITSANPKPGSTYIITDEKGRKVLNGSLNDAATPVDISHLVNGIYFINISEPGNKTVKIIKQ